MVGSIPAAPECEFAGAALLFSFTGLFILKMHAARRPTTWPIVGLGIVIPVVLALLFIH